MSISRIQKTLELKWVHYLNAIKNYCNAPDAVAFRDYIAFVSEDDDSIKYKLGKRTFLLKAEICPSIDILMLKTYELGVNPDDISKIKMKQIPLMDLIIYGQIDYSRFIALKDGMYSVGHSNTQLVDFCYQYFLELTNLLKQEEEIFYKNIPEIPGEQNQFRGSFFVL